MDSPWRIAFVVSFIAISGSMACGDTPSTDDASGHHVIGEWRP